MSNSGIINDNEETASEETIEPSVVTDIEDGRFMGFIRTLAYAVGHFFNDLCACMWFNYLVLFLEKVVRFRSYWAGTLMLVGQVTDALATPVVGYFSDKTRLLSRFGYGPRKTWHLFGSLCVVISFPFIFKCLACDFGAKTGFQILYFVPFICLFQIGWAAVQVSHLSLIPELAKCESTRTTLNGLRNVFTVIASVTVFTLMYLMLGDTGTGKISQQDKDSFIRTDFIVVGTGILFAIFFHIFVREPTRSRRLSPTPLSRQNSMEAPKMFMTHWLKEPQFYQVALLYMCSRLYINVSQVYLSFYVQYSQNYPKEYVAVFPLVACLSSFITSSLLSLPIINRLLNRKLTYLFGATIGCSTSIWMWFIDIPHQMYGISVALGVAQAVVLVTSLALTSDLISSNTETGAFVYGAMSFTDKLSNGIAYQIIQVINPVCNLPPHQTHRTCTIFYRDVMILVPGIALLVALIVLLTLIPQKIGQRRYLNSVAEDTEPIIRAIED